MCKKSRTIRIKIFSITKDNLNQMLFFFFLYSWDPRVKGKDPIFPCHHPIQWNIGDCLVDRAKTLFPIEIHPHPMLLCSLLWVHVQSLLAERLGTAPSTITWAGEEPCWPYYATVPYDLWLCLCASASLINIRAHTHNLTSTVLNTSYTSVSCATLLRIIFVYSTFFLVIVFSDPMRSSPYSR